MPLRKYLFSGIAFLLRHEKDGGIPSTHPGRPPGVWTTAEALEVFLTTPFFPKEHHYRLEHMVRFLLRTQLADNGGWPIAEGRETASSMATGQSVSALAKASNVLQISSVQEELSQAVDTGLQWLHKHQNNDGGWGLEPTAKEGQTSRVISTCYALKGYIGSGHAYSESKDVQRGTDFLTDLITDQGPGLGREKGAPADPCNTARAITIIIRSGAGETYSAIVDAGVNYLLAQRDAWKIDVESYVAPDAPGQVNFHSNTPYDVLLALLEYGYTGKEAKKLIRFFKRNQEDDGRWYLQDTSQKDREISTWATSEALEALDLAQRIFITKWYKTFETGLARRWKAILAILFLMATIEALMLFGVHEIVAGWWNELSPGWQQGVIVGIVGAFIMAVIANLVTEPLKRLWQRRVRGILLGAFGDKRES